VKDSFTLIVQLKRVKPGDTGISRFDFESRRLFAAVGREMGESFLNLAPRSWRISEGETARKYVVRM
jgi:hypothetical protein